jgi:hypothetical protein
MKKYSLDTNISMENKQLELLGKLTFAQKFKLTCSLTHSVIQLSRQAIGSAFPNLNKKEIDLKFIELNYGKELADKFDMHMKTAK